MCISGQLRSAGFGRVPLSSHGRGGMVRFRSIGVGIVFYIWLVSNLTNYYLVLQHEYSTLAIVHKIYTVHRSWMILYDTNPEIPLSPFGPTPKLTVNDRSLLCTVCTRVSYAGWGGGRENEGQRRKKSPYCSRYTVVPCVSYICPTGFAVWVVILMPGISHSW